MSSVENQNLAERSLIREDSLEYFIKFPPPQTFSHQHAAENYPEGDKIIILLFGWAGCQDRYLTKYSKIYEDQGFVIGIKETIHFCQINLKLTFFWFLCTISNVQP